MAIVVAMGTKLMKGAVVVANLTSIAGLELSADTIETTTLDAVGGYRTFTNGLKDAGEVGIEGFFDATAHAGLLADFEDGSLDAYTIEFTDKITTAGTKWNFSAIVTGYSTGADMEDLVSFEATLKISGKPTLVPAPTI